MRRRTGVRAMRSYLETPGLNLRLVNPRFHEGRLCQATARTSMLIRRFGAGAREEATGNLCLGSKALVQQRVGNFLSGLGQPERRSRRALPDRPTIKGRSHSCETLSPISGTPQMHIPLWLWFSLERDFVGGCQYVGSRCFLDTSARIICTDWVRPGHYRGGLRIDRNWQQQKLCLMFIINILHTYRDRGTLMRIGVNIPNGLHRRLEPLSNT